MASSSNLAAPFDTIMPSASTFVASSSGTKHIPYDVFINHCGKDAKLTVATPIYDSLHATGLMRVFLDKPELKLGDLLPKALKEAMASASIYIAIFSKHYAQSPWCLAELEFMVRTGKTIIPIFYYVEPSVLKWTDGGKGIYAEDFLKHEEKGRYTGEVLQRWKEALQQVSCCIGEIIKTTDDEHRVVKTVVNFVMNRMSKVPLEVAGFPVGLDEAVEDFNTIALQSAGSTSIVGIWGMGGSGKTTLAKEIFNRRGLAMKKSSFLFDLRDAAGNGKLVEKQKKLLDDLKVDYESFDHVDAGKGFINSRLGSLSVLIVLDDVDHKDQLDALLPLEERLGGQSLIIVTTRNKRVLEQWGISAIYPMRLLNATHAKQLFCWHAFLRNIPRSGFEDLVEKFLNACQGLPLSLKVLGGQLYGRFDQDYWQRTFNKYSQIPHEDITKRLKVSYDALGKQEKEMFLDTACLFIGKRKSAAIAAWDAEWDGLLGWETLFNKCLVEEDGDGLVRMHDHLRDLGRDIANGLSPHRLRSPHQVIEIPTGQEDIRVRGMKHAFGDNFSLRQGKIIVHTSQGERRLEPRSLGLKILFGSKETFVDYEKAAADYEELLSQNLRQLSRELIWLQYNGFEHKNLSSWFSLKELRILELSYSKKLQHLWKRDEDAPLQLRELFIKSSERWISFPESIRHLTNLKKIVIHTSGKQGSYVSSSLPEEFCHLQSLEHLELSDICNFPLLPSNFGKLTNLQHLSLTSLDLKELPDSFKKLTLLEYLSLRNCWQLTIQSELVENMTKLRYLNLNGCYGLKELRLPEVASLTELYLSGTSLKELPVNIFQLTKLTKLEIGSEFLTALPSSVKKIEGLQELSSLREPTIELDELPSFAKFTSLKEFALKGCEKLEKIESLEHLKSLEKLTIDDCPELNGLPGLAELTSLKEFDLQMCHKLKKIEDLENIKSLQNVTVSDCEELATFPSLPEITSQKDFVLLSCHKLKNIKGLKNIRSLEYLNISDCSELKALPNLSEMASLRELQLEKCYKLEKIEGLGNIRSLEYLIISDCSELEVLPNLSEMASLKVLQLGRCYKLEKIEGLERLKSLENLGLHTRWNAPCIVRLEHTEKLKSLAVVANHTSAVEPFVSNLQKWPEKVVICTRAVCDAGSLKNFFENLPNVSVLDYDMVEVDYTCEGKCLKLTRPKSSANAILRCYIINSDHPDLALCVNLGFSRSSFNTELGKGKWVWMGDYGRELDSFWREYIYARNSKGENVEVKVEAAWLVTGEKGSMEEALHRLFRRGYMEHTFAMAVGEPRDCDDRGEFYGAGPSTTPRVPTPRVCTSCHQLCYGPDQPTLTSGGHGYSSLEFGDINSYIDFFAAEHHPIDSVAQTTLTIGESSTQAFMSTPVQVGNSYGGSQLTSTLIPLEGLSSAHPLLGVSDQVETTLRLGIRHTIDSVTQTTLTIGESSAQAFMSTPVQVGNSYGGSQLTSTSIPLEGLSSTHPLLGVSHQVDTTLRLGIRHTIDSVRQTTLTIGESSAQAFMSTPVQVGNSYGGSQLTSTSIPLEGLSSAHPLLGVSHQVDTTLRLGIRHTIDSVTQTTLTIGESSAQAFMSTPVQVGNSYGGSQLTSTSIPLEGLSSAHPLLGASHQVQVDTTLRLGIRHTFDVVATQETSDF